MEQFVAVAYVKHRYSFFSIIKHWIASIYNSLRKFEKFLGVWKMYRFYGSGKIGEKGSEKESECCLRKAYQKDSITYFPRRVSAVRSIFSKIRRSYYPIRSRTTKSLEMLGCEIQRRFFSSGKPTYSFKSFVRWADLLTNTTARSPSQYPTCSKSTFLFLSDSPNLLLPCCFRNSSYFSLTE